MGLKTTRDSEGNTIVDELPNLVVGVHSHLPIGRYPTIPLPAL